MRVLVVDDEPSSRYLLETVFKARNHTVQSAQDGEEALELARLTPPDAIITDILMPRMDGYQLCMAWHDDPALASIPFIFYSATYVEDEDEQFAMTLGADAFMRKPADSAELVLDIEQLVREGASRRLKTRPAALPEEEILRKYNARLVDKLEKKVAELRLANERLTTAMQLLSDEVEVKNTLITRLNTELQRLEP
ncbi:MAG: response regulator [Coriobacteriia bacterium]|nr:response regulator [Coriobacteriia bacterium]